MAALNPSITVTIQLQNLWNRTPRNESKSYPFSSMTITWARFTSQNWKVVCLWYSRRPLEVWERTVQSVPERLPSWNTHLPILRFVDENVIKWHQSKRPSVNTERKMLAERIWSQWRLIIYWRKALETPGFPRKTSHHEHVFAGNFCTDYACALAVFPLVDQ